MVAMKRVLLNTPHRYGIVSMILHWVSVPWIAFLLVSGCWMVGLTYYDPLYTTLPYWHKLLGFLMVALMALRTTWLVVSPLPAPLSDSKFQRGMARAAHLTFYALLWMVCISGYVFLSADGKPIVLTSSLTLPTLFTAPEGTASLAGLVHEWLAYAIGGLAVVHALAALKHHLVDRDDTLKRMIRINPKE